VRHRVQPDSSFLWKIDVGQGEPDEGVRRGLGDRPTPEAVNGEERWTPVGHTSQLRILVVVWTMREESIRPITAFEAGKQLAKEYLTTRGL
jgi:hypothetical protein